MKKIVAVWMGGVLLLATSGGLSAFDDKEKTKIKVEKDGDTKIKTKVKDENGETYKEKSTVKSHHGKTKIKRKIKRDN